MEMVEVEYGLRVEVKCVEEFDASRALVVRISDDKWSNLTDEILGEIETVETLWKKSDNGWMSIKPEDLGELVGWVATFNKR